MTYNVFSGTLNPTQSINPVLYQSYSKLRQLEWKPLGRTGARRLDVFPCRAVEEIRSTDADWRNHPNFILFLIYQLSPKGTDAGPFLLAL